MKQITKKIATIEHHCIEQRYKHLRIHDKSAREKLINSIEQNNQLVPVVVVMGSANKAVLIDGHLRLQALQHLGHDTVNAEIWDCDVTEALLMVLNSHSGIALDVVEEALLLKELHIQQGLSQEVLAKRVGHNRSWISRRISLLEFMSENILQALCTGDLSLWVASRILEPVARATPEHAQLLLEYLLKHHRSTRELQLFYKKYQNSNRNERLNMVNSPELFFKAQRLLFEEKQAVILRDGAEGKWKYKLNIISTVLSELIELAPTVFYQAQQSADFRELLNKLDKAKNKLDILDEEINRLTNDRKRNTTDNNLS